MNLLSSIYTDEFRNEVVKHNNEAWSKLISELKDDIDRQYIDQSLTLDKDELFVTNKQRIELQTLLSSLITNHEE